MPNGMTFSGYACKNLKDNVYHLILFREASKEDTYTFKLPDSVSDKTPKIIYQNAPTDISMNGDLFTVKFSEQRSFVWLKVE